METVSTKSFLLEIGTEELPPEVGNKYSDSLLSELSKDLNNNYFTFSNAKNFFTPSRVSVIFFNLCNRKFTDIDNFIGPKLNIAFDKFGCPTLEALKFAKKFNIHVDQLKTTLHNGEQCLSHKIHNNKQNVINTIRDIVIQTIKRIPLKKSMYWGKHLGPFLRPVRWIVAILGNKIVPIEMFNVKSSNKTLGHKFHTSKPIFIDNPDTYETKLLNESFIILDREKRKNKILEQIHGIENGKYTIITKQLLDYSTDITEWPVVLHGVFNPKFLKIPNEVLINILEKKQKCFAVADIDGKLLPNFVIISNIESKNSSNIIYNNEKVVKSRFADAEYFYKTDRSIDFYDNLNKLKEISFYDSLGSLYDKSIRIEKLSAFIASIIKINIKDAARAAKLSKCDLVTLMVREFPELQGIIGYYYTKENENNDVSIAIKEQYLPKFSNDQIPKSEIGCILSIADRLDTIVGLFSVNKIPNGNKDPYGLRRATIGIIKILINKNLYIDIKDIILESCRLYNISKDIQSQLSRQVLEFIYDRLLKICRENGISTQMFKSVSTIYPTDLFDFFSRVNELNKFFELPESVKLINMHKRIKNVISDYRYMNHVFDYNLVETDTELKLFKIFKVLKKSIMTYYEKKQYLNLLIELLKFDEPLCKFFEKTIVISNNTKIKNNRISLLVSIINLFDLAYDLSYIQK